MASGPLRGDIHQRQQTVGEHGRRELLAIHRQRAAALSKHRGRDNIRRSSANRPTSRQAGGQSCGR